MATAASVVEFIFHWKLDTYSVLTPIMAHRMGAYVKLNGTKYFG